MLHIVTDENLVKLWWPSLHLRPSFIQVVLLNIVFTRKLGVDTHAAGQLLIASLSHYQYKQRHPQTCNLE